MKRPLPLDSAEPRFYMRGMIKRRSLPVILTLAALLTMGTSFADQPNMKDALAHLRSARAALAQAEKNKEGHRVRAIELIDQAIAEVERGIQAGALPPAR